VGLFVPLISAISRASSKAPRETATGGSYFRGLARQKRAKRITEGFEVDIYALTDGAYDYPADLLVEHVGNAYLGEIYLKIKAGQDPATGMANVHAGGRPRMLLTGKWVETLQRTAIGKSATATKARTKIKPGGGARNNEISSTLMAEFNRGRRYITLRGDVAEAGREALRQFVRAGIQGKVRPAKIRAVKGRQVVGQR
jgi:hypothetical protein